MFKSVLQSTHASIMALASIIMVPIRVNVQMDGRGKIVRQVGTFKSNILNYSSDVVFCRLTQNIYLFFIPDINECVSSPCYNNGSCINTQGSYDCECVEGWQDKNCHKGTR